MNLDEFRKSLGQPNPPAGLTHALAGLWWDAKGDWTRAHESAQQDEGTEGSWVHAYLHQPCCLCCPRSWPPSRKIFRTFSAVAGKTLGEWSAVWWKWAYAIPANDNPLLDLSGLKSKFGDVGPVFFLAGLFNASGSVTRTVTIPANKFIFFPLENLVNDNVGVSPRQTIDTLVSQIDAALPGVTALHASIDGREVGDLLSHREAAPVFSYTLQLTDNLQQVVNGITPDATGTVFPAVADGYYLMLRPLPAGQHVIKFGGVLFGGSLDVTYQVSVTSTRSIEPVVLVP